MTHLIAIDQGTTSTRAIVFDDKLAPVATVQQELRQIYPQPGWVEHDAEAIWADVVATVRGAMAKANVAAKDIAAIGITNQRETTIVWDRPTGKPIHNAIVWQDRRTADACAALRTEGHEDAITGKTGLLLDPYFSATKIAWLLDNVPGAREKAARGALAFGTVDSYLLWRLTGGRVHATDATNAARTLLFDIRKARWDGDLAGLFAVPLPLLPEVRDCASEFGETLPELFGGPIRVLGMAGDQQAATVGQGCFAPGMMKSTYGTGCFALLNTGAEPIRSRNRLLTTIAYQLDGKRTYALEGAIFIAGAAVQWLRDGLHLIKQASEVNALARNADPAGQVYLVPAFVGLGAPYWDADARGALLGLTRNTGPAEIAQAALESVGYQTRDLLEAMHADGPAAAGTVLRVDGGMTASDVTMQFLADILGAAVDRPMVMETTALGAAYLAGLKAGVCPDPAGFSKTWQLDRRFEPAMDGPTRARKWAGWQDAVRRTLTPPQR
ncbi:glycerol kinase GlpK [Rhodoplanes sp. Z2-YC6860]|uniref:glycerol kinase GlpK n=1 Tax=Rhodoplanes sp. Z2-YC6860 TaxID=674703 RepID=UPI00078E98A1|nr:glycerol kinase GlpK [Rhodoplanes sp. Z2-YC6860]AMN44571.1 glycerol kinase [Rhodoplanes sp. Z2-YC6860]